MRVEFSWKWCPCKILFMMPVVLLILLTVPTVSLYLIVSVCTEPRVGKARAEKLGEDSRSRGNCRHVYSLLAGMVVITQLQQSLSWLRQQP